MVSYFCLIVANTAEFLEKQMGISVSFGLLPPLDPPQNTLHQIPFLPTNESEEHQ